MENKTQHVIDAEGRIFRETFTRMEVDPGDSFQRAFTTGLVSRMRNIIELPGYGPCHVVLEHDSLIQYWSVPLATINFRTTFQATKKDDKDPGELFPTFGPKDSKEPTLEIEWSLADAMVQQDEQMNLRFMVMVHQDRNQTYHTPKEGCFLYAFDGRKSCWRLPIANLYDTSQVCMGEFSSASPTSLGVVHKALAQFRSATWNSDLFYDSDAVRRFIHFRPEGTSFKTLPILSPWTTFCQKISTATLKFTEI